MVQHTKTDQYITLTEWGGEKHTTMISIAAEKPFDKIQHLFKIKTLTNLK